MTLVDEMRSVKLQLTGIDKILGDLRTEEKEHPLKAHPGNPGSDTATWVAIRDGIEKRRQPLKKERERLIARKAELSAQMPNEALSKTTLNKVLHELLDIENTFSTQGWEQAWDRLSEYIDFLTEQEKTA